MMDRFRVKADALQITVSGQDMGTPHLQRGSFSHFLHWQLKLIANKLHQSRGLEEPCKVH